MKSARDLIIYTARNVLGIAGAGQPVEAEDYEDLKSVLALLLHELYALEACNIRLHPTDDDHKDIPEAYIGPLATVLANDVAPSYGKPKLVGAQRAELIMEVRRVTADGPRYFPQDVNYF